MLKKTVCVLLMCSIILAGCGGRVGNPVRIHQVGDEQKVCSQLKSEMFMIEEEIALLVPKSDKTGKNIALGATGIIFIIPLFFMDLKQGEKVELEAYQKRYNYLHRLYLEKDCASQSTEEMAK